jgi:hypothetical protein
MKTFILSPILFLTAVYLLIGLGYAVYTGYLLEYGKRNLPRSYFKGYRRIAKDYHVIEAEKCWCCKHQIAYVTWHCELKGKCNWERCYVMSELTKADKLSGGNKMLDLPPEPEKENV